MHAIFALFEEEFSPHLQALRTSSSLTEHYSFDAHSSIRDVEYLDPGRYAALCLYVNLKSIREEYYKRIAGFVQTGGGMIAFHSTSNSFRNQPSFEKMLGARFVRHGKISRYGIRPADPNDPLALGVTEFEVEDELYRQHYRRGVKTHFLHQGPRVAEPMVWSNTYGKGRIIGISPGHRVETMENGNLQRIIANSIKLILR